MWTLRALRIGSWLTRIIPVPIGYAISTTVALLFWLVNRKARQQVIANLRHVCPELGRVGLVRRSIRVVATVFWNYYDLLQLQLHDCATFAAELDVHGRERLTQALADGRGAIILSAHLGNFSVVAQYPALLGLRAAIIAERVEPPALFDYMSRLRSRLGVEIIPPGRQAIPPVLRLLRSNGVLLVAGDRDVLHQGQVVDFFGAPAPLPTGPMLLAMRTGATVVPAYTIRTSLRRSRVEILEPLPIQRTQDHEADLRVNMRRMAAALERMIAADPSQWAVLQRVWGEPPPLATPRGEGLGTVPSGVHAAEGRPTGSPSPPSDPSGTGVTPGTGS